MTHSNRAPLTQWLAPIACALAICAAPRPSAAQESTAPLERAHHTAWTQADSVMLGGSSRVLRSADGYVWLAHPLGAMRFDGVRFTLLDSADSPALRSERPGMFVPRIVDRAGFMWLARPDGALVTYRDGAFAVAVPASARAGTDVVEDGAGRVLIWNRQAFSLSRWRDGRIEPLSLPAELPRTPVLGVVRDTAGGLWIGFRDHGLWHLTTSAARHIPSPVPATEDAVRPLLHGRDGALWAEHAGSGPGIYRLEGDRWKSVTIEDPARAAAYARSAVEEPDGTIWFATVGAGLLRWDGNRLVVMTEEAGLSDPNVHSVLLEDDASSLWLTTDAGLERLRAAEVVTLSTRHGLPRATASRVVEDVGGHLWVQMHPGGEVHRLDGGRFREGGGPLQVSRVATPDGVDLQLLTASRDGGAWVAPYHGGLGRVDDAGLRRVDARAPEIHNLRVTRAIEARDGVVWMSFLRRGLGRFRDGRVEPVALPGTPNANVTDIAEDDRGHIWVSVGDRPILYELADGRRVRQLGADDGVRNAITQVALERGDTLWALTTSAILRIAGGSVSTVPAPGIGHILQARAAALIGNGQLWIASEAGIVRLSLVMLHRLADGSKERLAPVVLTALDGMPMPKSPTVSLQPIARTRDGLIWISTPAGLAVIEQTRRTHNMRPPRVLVEDVRIGGRRVDPSGGLTIGPGHDRLDIRFTATGLRVPERARLEYRLDGADDAWRAAGTPRLASYAELRPGRYRFRVRAWNEDAVPATHEATLAFRVLPMWYQTWWFMTLVLATVAASSAATIALVQRARHKQRDASMRAQFRATLDERTRLARELHDTLLQGFTGIVLQLEGLRHKLGQSRANGAEELSEILTLADSTLFDARQSVWDMRSRSLERQSLAEAIEETAASLTTGSAIELQFSKRGEVRPLPPAAETAVLHIGREAVRNAVHHANAKVVVVALTYSDRDVTLAVSDDGVGMRREDVNANGAGGHFGIVGMRERAVQAGGLLSITTAPGAGTRVELAVPA